MPTPLDADALRARLSLPAYPRSARYPPEWMLDSHMGPNVLWLTEALTEAMELRPGQRVLDLGCGKALSSIFLAREFGVQVWAADLWIAPSDNARRVAAAGLAEQVYPLRVEAHDLPFAAGFFDTAVSLDAYHYFGTDDLYLGWHLLKRLKPGAQIGIVVPGLREELAAEVPAHLQPYWDWQFWSFHSPAWWRRHWDKTGLVTVERADWLPDGWQHWLNWMELTYQQGLEKQHRRGRHAAGRCGAAFGVYAGGGAEGVVADLTPFSRCVPEKEEGRE